MEMLKDFFEKIIKQFEKKNFIKRGSSSSAMDEENVSQIKNYGIKILLFIILLVFLSLLFPSGVSFQYANLKIGMIAPEKIISSFTFPILKTDKELNEERSHVMQSIEDVFKKDSLVEQVELIKYSNFFSELNNIYNKENDLADILLNRDTIPEEYKTSIDTILYDWRIKYRLILNRRNLQSLFHLVEDKKIKMFQRKIREYLEKVYTSGIINIPVFQLVNQDISVISNNKEYILKPGEFYPKSEAVSYIIRRSSEDFNEAEVVELISTLVEAFCRENLYFQSEVTNKRRQDAVQNVPLSKGFVYKDQLIIDKGEIVTPETYNILTSFSVAQADKGILSANKRVVYYKLGIYVINALLLIIFVLYLMVYRSHIYENNRLLFLITIIFILQFAINYLFIKILGWSPLTMPMMLLPMMLGMLLDSGTAFTATFISAYFTAGIVGMDIYFSFYTLTTGIAAIYSTRRMRKRTDSIRAVVVVFLTYAFTFISLGFLRFAGILELLKGLLLPLVVTASFMFISYMLITLFEKLFDLTTDITLLELSDLNSPLLKKLSVDSPGTFHHSLIMGNLAEATASKIKANPLLARVGCYYHDIGKMEMPEYFVENQMGAMNRHESLQPNMSALILTNHVKKGLELAEKYKLPSAVKRFIPEHHGTSRMEYFYHKAKELSGDADLDDSDFRYPGPKPQIKETAIAMLADGIEAAARAIKNPMAGKINQMVNEMVNKKFEEGELENCDLTLRDLQVIKTAFIPILLGIHHNRIEYPKDEKKESTDKKQNESKEIVKNGKVTPEKPESELKIIQSRDEENTITT